MEAHPRPATIVNFLAHDFEQGQDSPKNLLVAANHKGQGGLDGARRRTGDGSTQKIDATRCKSFADPPTRGRADGAGIDNGQTLARVLQDTSLTQQNLL